MTYKAAPGSPQAATPSGSYVASPGHPYAASLVQLLLQLLSQPLVLTYICIFFVIIIIIVIIIIVAITINTNSYQASPGGPNRASPYAVPQSESRSTRRRLDLISFCTFASAFKVDVFKNADAKAQKEIKSKRLLVDLLSDWGTGRVGGPLRGGRSYRTQYCRDSLFYMHVLYVCTYIYIYIYFQFSLVYSLHTQYIKYRICLTQPES